MIKTSVVITSYNRREEVVRLLQCFLKWITKNPLEIILVDNASTDGTVEYVKKHFPQIYLIINERNELAVRARNQGYKAATGKYILSIDSDNYFTNDFLSNLIKEMENDSQVGMVGPLMLYRKYPNKIFFAGADISLTSSLTHFDYLFSDCRKVQLYKKFTGHIPNCFLFKRKILSEIGYMDEDYIMSYGESDFAEKIKKAGYKILFSPQSIIYHDAPLLAEEKPTTCGFRSTMRAYFFGRNRIIFMKKNAGIANFILFSLFINPVIFIFYLFNLMYYQQFNLLKYYFLGYFDGILFVFFNRKHERGFG